jgi:hypothetical protein
MEREGLRMTRSDIESGIEKMIQSSKVAAKLQVAGLPIPKKPQCLSNNVTLFEEWEKLKKTYGGIGNIPFDELGDFLDKWTAVISYSRWIEAISDIKQLTSREIRDTVEKQLYTLQEGGREIRAASVHTEELFIQWENRYLEDSTYYLSVRGLRESYEYRANSISREITRRASEAEGSKRSYNRGGA